MEKERLIHDWLVETLKTRLSRDYKEIKDNLGKKKHEFKGQYPDLILANHGIVLAVVEVETEATISEEAANRWKEIIEAGVKLTLMVPKRSTKEVTSLLWEKGIADKVSIGTYDILINMP
jgi:hypothetical protein